MQVFSHRHYDHSGALKQWRNQQPLGLQTIFQTEMRETNKVSLSIERLEDALFRSLTIVDSAITIEASHRASSVIGDGCVVAANWPGGNVVVLWDGRTRVDINLFTYEGGVQFADEFESAFLTNVKPLETVLRDTQPRGTGRVVHFKKPEDDPLWIM